MCKKLFFLNYKLVITKKQNKKMIYLNKVEKQNAISP